LLLIHYHLITSKHTIPTSNVHPADTDIELAALAEVPTGTLPRYQLPISVSLPLLSSMAEFGPTLDALDRNEPK
jgi:hypothetical protein